MKTHMACAEFNYYFTNICYADGNTRQFHGSALVPPVMVNETIGPIGYMLDKEESTAWWNMFLTFSSDDPSHTLNKELQNRLAETGELVFPGGEYIPGWPKVRSYFEFFSKYFDIYTECSGPAFLGPGEGNQTRRIHTSQPGGSE